MAGEQENIYDVYDWQAQLDFATPGDAAPAIPDTVVGESAQTTNPNQHDASNHSLWQRALGSRVVGAAATLALVLSAAEGINIVDGGNSQPTQYVSAPPCNAPSPGAVRAVDKLFGAANAGSEGTIAATQMTGVELDYDLSGGSGPYSQPGTIEYTRARPGYSLRVANENLAPFGFTVQDGVEGGTMDGLRNPTTAELDSDINPALYEITNPLTFLPIKLVHLSGLKKLILMANPRADWVFEWDNPHTLVWNIAQQPYYGEMDQALYQGIDTAECSFDDSYQSSDPKYANLSGGGYIHIYGPHGQRQGLYSLDQFTQGPNPDSLQYGDQISVEGSSLLSSSAAINQAFKQAQVSGDYGQYCNLVNHYQENIVVPTQESFENSYIDKTDLGGMLLDMSLNNNYDAFLNPDSPVLRRKAIFLLARLYDAAPNAVRYMADVDGGYSDYAGDCD